MGALLTVFLKELRENARDRRTMLSALVLGPLGAPLLFTIMLNASVVGRASAPNLVAFLEREGVRVHDIPGGDAQAAAIVRGHGTRLALVIPPDYGARFATARPARVQLYTDTADASAGTDRARAQSLLRGYAGQIATWRLQARGISPSITQPVVVDEVDVSTPAARALAVLGMLSYFIVFATLMGGLYVAIDATAGERERGSLEPLLTLPVSRSALVAGKILTASAYMALSLGLTVTAFSVCLRFLHLDSLGMALELSPRIGLAIFGVVLPFVLLGASLMTIVASFTRSYREAQSWLAAVILVPTVPIMFAGVYQVELRSSLLWIPSLSQHLLIGALLKGDSLQPSDVLLSVGTTLAAGLLLAGIAMRLYEREKILG